MKRSKGEVLGWLGLAILTVSLALSAPGTSRGQGGGGGGASSKDVLVVNATSQPVPVSVQGTASIAGSLTLSGTPNVHVVSLPAVSLAGNPALQPWQNGFSLDMASGETSKLVIFPALPPGKRLVLEFGSAELTVIKGQLPSVQITGTLEGVGSATHVLDVTNIGEHAPLQDRWRGSHMIKMYLDNGFIRVTRSGSSANVFFGSASLTGYLVDLP